MKRYAFAIAILTTIGVAVGVMSREAQTPPEHANAILTSGFRAGEEGLNESERAGRKIWFYATAGNDRFHTYVFQQRLGVLIDWYGGLKSQTRDTRFKKWGLINDPDCCRPGDPDCPAKSFADTYGFDYCPGDADLLKFVGKSGYRDPACDLQDASGRGNKEDLCHLAFGTSTGVLGLRKFPNPRFDAERWRKLNNGQLGTWEGYNHKLSKDASLSDSRVSRLADGSVEPPFRIGMACGACHIAFDPLKPPKNPEHPKWENISGTVGNQYARISQILISGMATDSLEWQVFSHTRPGTTDTSGVPTDQVNNAGSQNAIINFKQRPLHAGEKINKWRKVDRCPKDAKENACWCEPGKDGKCWEQSLKAESVHHILKGGEDSTGIHEAVQRVYFNIGSCSEQGWVNHLTDLRQLDPKQRGFGQTPFDVAQVRRNCPNFRAIEDRLPDIVNFLLSKEGTASDLHVAKGLKDRGDLIEQLDKQYGKGAVARGKAIFAANCARCHSSQEGPVASRDFYALDPKTGLRLDWLGNDKLTPASELGSNYSRALHSNHMTGHVWEAFGSETLRAKPPDPNIKEPGDGGRGYLRNISLLSVWAHAPFLHNNAVGPEICGAPLFDHLGNPLANANPAGCWQFDPSVEGRFKLFEASVQSLLNPQERGKKITRLDRNIVLEIGPRLWDGKEEKKIIGFTVTVPKGTPAALLGNFFHKPFFIDLVAAKIKPDELKARLTKRLGTQKGDQLAAELRQIADEIIDEPEQLLAAVKKRLPLLLEVYSSSTDLIEDRGHPFGEKLSPADKKALIAFLATL
jgi:hypothetical protein